MKRARSNSWDRTRACRNLAREFQGKTVGQKDLFGNDVGQANEFIRVSHNLNSFDFNFVKEDLQMTFDDESNEVFEIRKNGEKIEHNSNEFKDLANRVYKLVDREVRVIRKEDKANKSLATQGFQGLIGAY